MQTSGTAIELSASDLSGFLHCIHLTALDLAVTQGQRQAPNWTDPALKVLRERGLGHERNYIEGLRAEGLAVTDLTNAMSDDAVARSTHAMRTGVDVIVQPALRNDRWFGRPDVLHRNGRPSAFGSWSYEVIDTKLTKETRGGTILQLALYSELLGLVQGVVPECFRVVTPDPVTPVHTYRVEDFAAYFRLIRDRLAATSLQDPMLLAAEHYPEPVEHCEVCRWSRTCDKKRHDDDHLSLVAGMRRLQSCELEAAGVTTLAELGMLPLPLLFRPRRGAAETYVRLREQARVQLEGRIRQVHYHELLQIEQDHGLARLPAPSPGDIFLDLEGDPFVGNAGREYLFGLVTIAADGSSATQSHWAYSDKDERIAFETVVDDIMRSWESNPGMHVYHYAPYERAAFRRLMGRYATRESEVDRMLRGALFVDLHAVVKQALLASVEQYSIKDLEPFYGFRRVVKLEDANTNLRVIARALELGALNAITPDVRDAVEGYNLDDCRSALQLRGWLEQLRASVEATGTNVPRPQLTDGTPSEPISERARRVKALVTALTAGLPTELQERSEEQQAQWLLAHLLDWHRREAKAPWWEFFRLRDLMEEELLDEKAAVAGLRFVARIGGTQRCPIDRYVYPPQETDIQADDELHLPDGKNFGDVEAIDRVARALDVKKRGAQADVHPSALFAHSVVTSDVLAEALLRIAADVVDHGISGGSQYRAAREILLRRPPRLRSGEFAMREGETAVQFAVRIATDLDDTVLAIQGPPGAGKTYTGARMICELVRRGARVGVTAVSHKVIRNLLDAVITAAKEGGLQVSCVQKVTTESETPSSIEEITNNDVIFTRLKTTEPTLLAELYGCGRNRRLFGLSMCSLWMRPVRCRSRTSLPRRRPGEALCYSAIPNSLISPNEAVTQKARTSQRWGTSWAITRRSLLTGEYSSRKRGGSLRAYASSRPKCSTRGGWLHVSASSTRCSWDSPHLKGLDFWVEKIRHEGNQNFSVEEVDAVDRIVEALIRPGARWIDCDQIARSMTASDVLVVAPYNAQVALLEERLGPRGVRVGTVDKFQGQEAPVVIYSMATSAPEDAPHGMEFLYNLNRFNVATSRARCACILVASPRLFEPDCKSPHQMRLANALCRYIELAQAVAPISGR